MTRFIQNLNEDEASRVLNDLLRENPNLTKKVYNTAKKVAGDVDADAITDDVFSKLDRLDVDDLNGRAGSTRHGYVEPSEAAWGLFEEALSPFIDEMKKNQKRALPAAAKAYCIGIVKGLWKYDDESSSDLKEWLVDAPGEYAYTVFEEWKKGNPDDEDIAEVMDVVNGGSS
jgi:hypothetical protein